MQEPVCVRVVGMIATALIWEQERAYDPGMATVHACKDAEETAGEQVTESPARGNRVTRACGDSVRWLRSESAHGSKGSRVIGGMQRALPRWD